MRLAFGELHKTLDGVRPWPSVGVHQKQETARSLGDSHVESCAVPGVPVQPDETDLGEARPNEVW